MVRRGIEPQPLRSRCEHHTVMTTEQCLYRNGFLNKKSSGNYVAFTRLNKINDPKLKYQKLINFLCKFHSSILERSYKALEIITTNSFIYAIINWCEDPFIYLKSLLRWWSDSDHPMWRCIHVKLLWHNTPKSTEPCGWGMMQPNHLSSVAV